jgi:hypothetical protein
MYFADAASSPSITVCTDSGFVSLSSDQPVAESTSSDCSRLFSRIVLLLVLSILHFLLTAGNKVFRAAVSSALNAFVKASNRFEKAVVVNQIIESVRARGGRFLKQNHAGEAWVVLTEQQTKEKVGHAVRDAVNTHDSRKVSKGARESQDTLNSSLASLLVGDAKDVTSFDDRSERMRKSLDSLTHSQVGDAYQLAKRRKSSLEPEHPGKIYAQRSHSLPATMPSDLGGSDIPTISGSMEPSGSTRIGHSGIESAPARLSQSMRSSYPLEHSLTAQLRDDKPEDVVDSLRSFYHGTSAESHRNALDALQPHPYRPNQLDQLQLPPAAYNLPWPEQPAYGHLPIDAHPIRVWSPTPDLHAIGPPPDSSSALHHRRNDSTTTTTSLGLATHLSTNSYSDQFIAKIDDVLGPLPPDAQDPFESLLMRSRPIRQDAQPQAEVNPDTSSSS